MICLVSYTALTNIGTLHYQYLQNSLLLPSLISSEKSLSIRNFQDLSSEYKFSNILIFTQKFKIYHWNKCCPLFASKWWAHFIYFPVIVWCDEREKRAPGGPQTSQGNPGLHPALSNPSTVSPAVSIGQSCSE